MTSRAAQRSAGRASSFRVTPEKAKRDFTAKDAKGAKEKQKAGLQNLWALSQRYSISSSAASFSLFFLRALRVLCGGYLVLRFCRRRFLSDRIRRGVQRRARCNHRGRSRRPTVEILLIQLGVNAAQQCLHFRLGKSLRNLLGQRVLHRREGNDIAALYLVEADAVGLRIDLG